MKSSCSHFTPFSSPPGLLYIQNGDSLEDLSGFDNVVQVHTLVLALLGDSMTTITGFSSLHSASRLYITRNSVSQPNPPSLPQVMCVCISATETGGGVRFPETEVPGWTLNHREPSAGGS